MLQNPLSFTSISASITSGLPLHPAILKVLQSERLPFSDKAEFSDANLKTLSTNISEAIRAEDDSKRGTNLSILPSYLLCLGAITLEENKRNNSFDDLEIIPLADVSFRSGSSDKDPADKVPAAIVGAKGGNGDKTSDVGDFQVQAAATLKDPEAVLKKINSLYCLLTPSTTSALKFADVAHRLADITSPVHPAFVPSLNRVLGVEDPRHREFTVRDSGPLKAPNDRAAPLKEKAMKLLAEIDLDLLTKIIANYPDMPRGMMPRDLALAVVACWSQMEKESSFYSVDRERLRNLANSLIQSPDQIDSEPGKTLNKLLAPNPPKK